MKNENGKITITAGMLIGLIALLLIIIVCLVVYKVNVNENKAKISEQNSFTESIKGENKNSNVFKENANVTSKNHTTSNNENNMTTVNNTDSDVSNSKTHVSENKESDVIYEVEIKDEVTAKIIATKNGKKYEKEINNNVAILENCTGTVSFSKVGNVAVITETGGEYCVANIYQLIKNEIKLIGTIDCGADMNNKTNYSFNQIDEVTVSVESILDNKSNKKDIIMSATIDNIEKVKLFDLGWVLLIAETGGEYYGIKTYRASYDYTNGDYKDIVEVGSITPNFIK